MAKLTTGVVRLSYANIASPRKNDDGKAKYSSQIIIDKTDKKTIKAFERAIEELKADPKAVAKVEGKAAYLKLNLRDGDTDEAVVDQPETYAGKYFINANSDKQPIVFTRDKIKMDDFDIEEEIYSGVYAQVALSSVLMWKPIAPALLNMGRSDMLTIQHLKYCSLPIASTMSRSK